MSNSLRSHGLQYKGFLVLHYLSPRVFSDWDSCPLMPSNRLIFCHLLLLLPSIFTRIRVFSNDSALRIRWPKYWSFSFSISPSNEYSGLISFRIDWFDLLAVQGILKSLLHHCNSKTSILKYKNKNINPSVFSLLYGPTLTSVQDYWKNYSFDCCCCCC